MLQTASRLLGLDATSSTPAHFMTSRSWSETIPLRIGAALSNRRTSDALRSYLAAQRGGENIEFLLAYLELTKTRNSLQRFHYLTEIMAILHWTALRGSR